MDGEHSAADEPVAPEPPPLVEIPASPWVAAPVEPAEPPAPAGPPRWPVAVALLNLTGLSLGYWYVGARLRAGLYLVATAALVGAAFATDAASRPWLWRAIAVIWVGSMAVDGWRLARRHPDRAAAPRTRPGLAAAAAVLVVAMSYGLYGVAGDRTFASGQAAQASGDCEAATDRYDRVTGPYELTLSGNVTAATQHRAYCTAYLSAVAEHDAGRFDAATARYREYLASTPATTLDGFVHANLQRAYLEWGRSARAAKDYETAIDAYRDMLDEYGDTQLAQHAQIELAETYLDQAAQLRSTFDPNGGGSTLEAVRGAMRNYVLVQQEFPQTEAAEAARVAMVETYAEAVRPFANGKFCESLPILDYLVGLPPGESVGLVGKAHDDRAKGIYECGVLRYRAGSFDEATTLFEKFVDAYPQHALATSARSALIASTIAAEGPAAIPALPPPLGDDSPGSISVTFYNDSSLATEVLISGPTAHRVVLPGCQACPVEYASETEACPSFDGRPSVQLRLLAGDYQLLSRDTVGHSARPHQDTLSVLSGYTHTYCLFIVPLS